MKRLFAFLLFIPFLLQANQGLILKNKTISEKTKIIIGIRAWKGIDIAYKEWSATIDYLNENVQGYEFKLYPLVNYEEIKNKIKNKDIDFLISDPVLYIESEYLYGVTRLATLQRKNSGLYFDKYGAVIFTSSKNKHINSFKDLKNTTFVGVAKEALAGYRMAHREMLLNSVLPEKVFKNILFTEGRGDVVVHKVLKNDNYVGTVRTGLLENMIKKGAIQKDDIKIIHKIRYDYFPFMVSTKLYPEFPFSRLSHVPEELGKKVLIALLSIDEDSKAAKNGQYSRWLIPNDYSDITTLMKELQVGIYKDFNKITLQKVFEEYSIVIVSTLIFMMLLLILSIRLKKQSFIIKREKEKVSKLFDTQDSIVILSNGEDITLANKKFLEFFHILELNQFTNQNKCICDKFEYEEGKDYIQSRYKGKKWNEYIKAFPNDVHKVKIKSGDNNFHIFKINIAKYSVQESLDIITFHDISDLEILEEKNRENQKLLHEHKKMIALKEMIGNIAHQWRQPLSVISTVASGLKIQYEMGTIGDKELFKSLDQITSTTEYISKTIDNFNDYLNGDSKFEVFNLTKKIDKSLELENDSIKQYKIKIIKNLDDTIMLNTLPFGLSQALENIINNAKDALVQNKDQNSRFLFIKTNQTKDKAMITIKDSAGGISDEIIDKVFEPYFTTKHQSQGTGLGLHIAYQIIAESMNGKINIINEKYIYNDKEYKGAKFIIELPLNL